MSESRDDLPRVEAGGVRFVWSRQLGAWVCQDCGGLVGDYVKHGRWHADSVPR